MIIKSAELADLNQCMLIDPSYMTEYVWQMYLERGEAGTWPLREGRSGAIWT